MLKKNDDGEWVVTIGPRRGKTLDWHVKHRSHWLIEFAICTGHVTPEEVAIVNDALKERERELNAIERVKPLQEVRE